MKKWINALKGIFMDRDIRKLDKYFNRYRLSAVKKKGFEYYLRDSALYYCIYNSQFIFRFRYSTDSTWIYQYNAFDSIDDSTINLMRGEYYKVAPNDLNGIVESLDKDQVDKMMKFPIIMYTTLAYMRKVNIFRNSIEIFPIVVINGSL